MHEGRGGWDVRQCHCEGMAALDGGVVRAQHEWLEGGREECREVEECVLVGIGIGPQAASHRVMLRHGGAADEDGELLRQGLEDLHALCMSRVAAAQRWGRGWSGPGRQRGRRCFAWGRRASAMRGTRVEATPPLQLETVRPLVRECSIVSSTCEGGNSVRRGRIHMPEQVCLLSSTARGDPFQPQEHVSGVYVLVCVSPA